MLFLLINRFPLRKESRALSNRGERLFVLRCAHAIISFFLLRGWWTSFLKQIASQSSETMIPLGFNGTNPGRDGLQRLWPWHIPPLPTRLAGRHETGLL